MRGTSELGIGHVTMTHDRVQVVDFTLPCYQVGYTYVVYEPLPLDPFKAGGKVLRMAQFDLISLLCRMWSLRSQTSFGHFCPS